MKIKYLSLGNECVYNTSNTVYTQKPSSCVTLNYEAVTSLFHSKLFDIISLPVCGMTENNIILTK